jgi:hypothetical protein
MFKLTKTKIRKKKTEPRIGKNRKLDSKITALNANILLIIFNIHELGSSSSKKE